MVNQCSEVVCTEVVLIIGNIEDMKIAVMRHRDACVSCVQPRTYRENKEAELSQRWPRDAFYIRVPENCSRVPEYAHGYFWTFPEILMRICSDRTYEFEVRSFTHSWDNTGYPKIFRKSLDTPTLPFLQNFLIGFCSDGPWECIS